MLSRTLQGILLCAGVFSALPSAATTVLERSLTEMGTASGLIIRGRVLDQRANWNADHSQIETTVHVKIRQILKGGNLAKPGDTVTLVQPGGVVGDVGQLVPGGARFADGEDVVLFLENGPQPGVWILERLAASKFKVEVDVKGTTRLVRDVSDLSFVERRPNGFVEPTENKPPSTFTLDEVRASLSKAKGK